jgi:hypothetical protein
MMVDQQPADPVSKEQVYKFHVRDAFLHKLDTLKRTMVPRRPNARLNLGRCETSHMDEGTCQVEWRDL